MRKSSAQLVYSLRKSLAQFRSSIHSDLNDLASARISTSLPTTMDTIITRVYPQRYAFSVSVNGSLSPLYTALTKTTTNTYINNKRRDN